MTPGADRATYRSKLELFNQRVDFQLPTSVAPEELENISFYCFWRLYSVQGNRLRKRQQEKHDCAERLWLATTSEGHARFITSMLARRYMLMHHAQARAARNISTMPYVTISKVAGRQH